MPYSIRTRDRILRRPIAAQNTIPNGMADARYSEELLKWQRQDDLNRGYLSEDDKERFIDAFSTGNYDNVIPEGDLFTRRRYDDARDYIDRISYYYGIPREEVAKRYVNEMNSENSRMRHSIEPLDPSTQQSFASRLIWGDDDPEDELADEQTPGEGAADIGWDLTPFWGLMYARELEKKWQRGYKPGLVEAAMLGIPFVARPVYRAGKAFMNAFRNRRAYERALKANALPMPEPNTKVFTGRKFEDKYVAPDMEFTPYEEVRF